MRKVIYTNANGDSIEFSRATGIHITDDMGLSKNSITLSESTVSNQIGSSITGKVVEPKDFTITGKFKNDPNVRKKMLAVILPGVAATFRYIDEEEGIDVYWDVEPKETPYISWDRNWQDFQFMLHAAYPYPKEKEAQLISFNKLESNFMFPQSYSSTEPFTISTRIWLPLLTFSNKGDLPTGFILQMKAEAEIKNPKIVNVVTQDHLSFGKNHDLTMQNGDILEISTYTNQKYCHLLRGEEVINVFWMMDFDSIFFQLAVGENVLRYSADTNEQNLIVELSFETVRAGV